MMGKKLSRRDLLRILAAAVARVGWGVVAGGSARPSLAEDVEQHKVFIPMLARNEPPPPTATATPRPPATPTATSTPTPTPTSSPTATNEPPLPPPTGSRVVHVHSPNATHWNYGDDYYGDYVDQDVVTAMVDRGVMDLTGATSVAQAWRSLVPDYAPGKAIAIKVNFNNCRWCSPSTHPEIDALSHPINAIIRGLSQAYANWDASDLWIYDATVGKDPPISYRHIPNLFKDDCQYPGVRFFDQGCNNIAGYTSSDNTAKITWHNPSSIPTPPALQVTDVLVQAEYVINMPIMKRHLSSGVTLAFKNHFGSIPYPNLLHDWVFIDWANYGGTAYSPVVDVYRNPHILGKTVLTIGDGLFGNFENNISKPTPWTTFGGDAPNSLFFSTDPVAIDCTMCDLLEAEQTLRSGSDDYLVYAANLGLGVYERGDPWGSGYSAIDYHKVGL